MEKKDKIQNIIAAHETKGKYIEVNGLRTFLLDRGEGDAVLCVHGVPTSSFLYRKVIDSLAAKGLRGISVDLPGLGLSARPENFDYTFPSFADFLKATMEEMKIDKFHLVVHDIGGPIGFAVAAENPDKILSLTILNTWVDVVNFKKPLVMQPFEKKILGEAQLKMIGHTTWPIMFSKMGVNNADHIPQDEINTYVDLLKREDDGKAFLKIMRNFSDSPEYRDLCKKAVRNVPYPVQAIWGADDPALTLEEYGKEIKESADLKEFTELSSKHFLQEEKWEEIADKIAQIAHSPM
jgi:pimeloyl-ACP methyl ester carboxylesterase